MSDFTETDVAVINEKLKIAMMRIANIRKALEEISHSPCNREEVWIANHALVRDDEFEKEKT